MALRALLALAVIAAVADAFTLSPSAMYLSRGSSAVSRASGLKSAVRSTRPSLALRMQTEDDKAKAAGIAFATVGLVFSKFSLLVAVLAGGAAVYAGEQFVPSMIFPWFAQIFFTIYVDISK